MSESALKILLLLLALGLLTAPLMAALPSPAERRRKPLRRRAMEMGLRVRLARLPGAEAGSADGAAYVLARTQRSGGVGTLWLSRSGGHWRAQSAGGGQAGDTLDMLDTLLERALGALPETVQAVACHADSIEAYWRETGDESDVERIAEALWAVRDLGSALDAERQVQATNK